MEAAIIGGGSWGSAFSLHLGRRHLPTRLWIREKDIREELLETRQNSVFLPGFTLPPEVSFSADIRETASSAGIVFIAVPSRFCRSVFREIGPVLKREQIVVSLTKGIEEGSLKRMTEVMAEVFQPAGLPRLAVLSGPSFAREVAEKHPTAVVIAAARAESARTVQRLVSDIHFRAYTSADVAGVELAGALKNVIAVACGISDALRFGHNTRAALITRGIAENSRLALKFGARKETFLGLAGIGDLVLTCTARRSRNYHVGFELGKGRSLREILDETPMVAEGVTTTVSALDLARREHVEMPISTEVFRVLYENKDPRKSLGELMLRTLKEE
ncbi:MAG: NAD(P)H-dependent glycerol-3-phosphate dehydrogenase [Candidatus Aminicenantes bacterium]|nr:NAD(P)H-dependent glycerol-3-phosphate dehydrogenase [Candidatus Aminicenantes bacterium]